MCSTLNCSYKTTNYHHHISHYQYSAAIQTIPSYYHVPSHTTIQTGRGTATSHMHRTASLIHEHIHKAIEDNRTITMNKGKETNEETSEASRNIA